METQRLSEVEKEIATEVAKKNAREWVEGSRDPESYCLKRCGEGRGERE